MNEKEMLIARLMELYDEWRAFSESTRMLVGRFGRFAMNREHKLYPTTVPVADAFYQENPHKAFKMIYNEVMARG